jgi:hypothetical protein
MFKSFVGQIAQVPMMEGKMSLRFLGVALAVALFAGRAEAGIFGSGDRLPKPISLTSNRVERSSNQGFPARHPPKEYSNPKWGTRWDLAFKAQMRPSLPSLRYR